MHKIRSKSGFTLVEIIISLMIFTIVAVVALTALVKIISANKKAQTLQSSITNLNFALETMSREMRVGSTYHCDSAGNFTSPSNDDLTPLDCTQQKGKTIAFISSKVDPDDKLCGLIFAYRFVNKGTQQSPIWELQKAQKRHCRDVINPGIGNTDFAAIVSDKVTITDYNLYVSYNENNQPYPIATIRLTGFAGTKEKEKTYFDVQTAISARTI